jgi:fructose-bisphosphate aldolase class I
MNIAALVNVAGALVADGKGLLAADESIGTCNRRFAAAGLAQTVGMRRAYRDLLVTAPALGHYISGVILFDETIGQSTADGRPFVAVLSDAGILAGIKVDMGTQDLAGHPGEKVTEGLDGLRGRLKSYAQQGAAFAKWRAVFTPGVAGTGGPSLACRDANAHALARYAALCQEAGLVPIVEAEVLMDGAHTLARCAEVTEAVLRRVFEELARQTVVLEAMILKPNMALPGLTCPQQPPPGEVAAATVQTLLRTVPAAVAGITFLSGGQTALLATERLNALHAPAGSAPPAGVHARPWPLSFSFARALQYPALEIWGGKDANRAAAQAALVHRARCNCAALRGDYQPAMESE